MKVSWTNVLQSSTVTVTSAATGYDAYRLYDNLFVRQWVATSTATQTIHVDRGAGSLEPVDTLIIPAGHLLSGCGMTFERSSNNGTWTPIVTGWTQSGSALILKQGAATNTDRYLRCVISGASVAPQAGEVWMGLLTTFASGLSIGTRHRLSPTQITQESLYGKTAHSVSLGVALLRIDGQVRSVIASEVDDFESWFDVTPSGRFFFEDHRGGQYFARFEDQPELEGKAAGFYAVSSLRIAQVAA